MRKKLKETTHEALAAVLPITVIVFILSVVVTPMPVGTLMLFLFGSVLLVFGMGLFTMGADMSMMRMGEDIGATMTKPRRILVITVVCFAMGVIITIAEPDLQVLAHLIPSIPNMTLILAVAVGVGVFLVLAVLRILFRISLPTMLVVCYGIVLVLSLFTPDRFVPVAFDSGGVTTGPITVPFIMALGLGLASVRGDRDSLEDSFGLVALCSTGPILAVLPSALIPGDVIQLMNPQGTFYHSLFLLRVVGDEFYIATHTLDAYMRPLSSYTYHRASFLHILGGREDA